MDIYLDFNVNLDKPEIKALAFDYNTSTGYHNGRRYENDDPYEGTVLRNGKIGELFLDVPEPPSSKWRVGAIKIQDKYSTTKSFDIPLLINEKWSIDKVVWGTNGGKPVIVSSTPMSRTSIISVYENNILVAPVFYLFLHIDVPSTTENRISNWLRNYDHQGNSQDLLVLIKAKLTEYQVDESQFLLESSVRISCNSAPQLRDPNARARLLCLHKQIDENGKFRDTHFSSSSVVNPKDMFRLQSANGVCGDFEDPVIFPDLSNADNEPKPSTYSDWSNEQSIRLRFHSERIAATDSPSQDETHTIDATPGTEMQVLDRALEQIISNSDPVCTPGTLTSSRYKVTTIVSFPEYKIEWRTKRIEIGCSRVTINLPVLRQRNASLNLYIFIVYPKDMSGTSFKILKSCAISAALVGGVLGSVTGNFAVAVVTFNKVFKICVEVRVKECFDGGPLMLKVIDRDWYDVS